MNQLIHQVGTNQMAPLPRIEPGIGGCMCHTNWERISTQFQSSFAFFVFLGILENRLCNFNLERQGMNLS